MTATTEHVVLVDEQDQYITCVEKLYAHQCGLLHRAFSIFIFKQQNNIQELLLQQRAANKYHSPLLWTNTCCSHPRLDEPVIQAGERRLKEELGIHTTLSTLGWFHYQAQFDNGLLENEIDHVLIGHVDTGIQVIRNPYEVNAYRWVTLNHLQAELAQQPEKFTPWFSKALTIICSAI
jgi:isopentenyl-diphosphate delta-isomerase type 1